ncbi:MAG: hypothetical protein Q9180_007879 [Flavoplaca navasiana]
MEEEESEDEEVKEEEEEVKDENEDEEEGKLVIKQEPRLFPGESRPSETPSVVKQELRLFAYDPLRNANNIPLSPGQYLSAKEFGDTSLPSTK